MAATQELVHAEGAEALRAALAVAEAQAAVLQGHGAEARLRAAKVRLAALEAEEKSSEAGVEGGVEGGAEGAAEEVGGAAATAQAGPTVAAAAHAAAATEEASQLPKPAAAAETGVSKGRAGAAADGGSDGGRSSDCGEGSSRSMSDGGEAAEELEAQEDDEEEDEYDAEREARLLRRHFRLAPSELSSSLERGAAPEHGRSSARDSEVTNATHVTHVTYATYVNVGALLAGTARCRHTATVPCDCAPCISGAE